MGLNDLAHTVNGLTALGIQCPESVIQLFLDEGQDPVQEIAKIHREITSAGYDCASFFDTLVIGCQQYGSPRAYLWHLAKQEYAKMIPHLEEMVHVWGASARPPVDMMEEIDSLLAQYPGFGATHGSQGFMASTFVARYADIKDNIYKMAGPMSSPPPSSPWQGRDYGRYLQEIWDSFYKDSTQRLESEYRDGTLLGWRLAGVALCIVAIIYDDVVVAAVAVELAAPSFGTSVVVGGGEIALWDLAIVCLAMLCLGILDLFIKMLLLVLGLLVDMIIMAPLIYGWHELQLTFAASSSTGVHVLTPGERGQAVQDAWNEIQKKLGEHGKTMQDLEYILKDVAPLKEIIELLVCMGYSAADIATLLDSLTTNIALDERTYPLSPDAIAKGVTVGKGQTLPKLFEKLLRASKNGMQGNYQKAYAEASRVLNGIMEIGPGNIKAIGVHYTTPTSGPNSEADLIDTNGNIYEIGGDNKSSAFDPQYRAAEDFIEKDGTGNPHADIYLWVEAGNKTMKKIREKYGNGNMKNPSTYQKLQGIKQLEVPVWRCGTGYQVGSTPSPGSVPSPTQP